MPCPDLPLGGKLILLATANAFAADYVSSGIGSAGGRVLGPSRSIEETDALLRNLRRPPDAAVFSADIFGAIGASNRAALARAHVPLLLINHIHGASDWGQSVLPAPFSAYQVVEFLCDKLATPPPVSLGKQ